MSGMGDILQVLMAGLGGGLHGAAVSKRYNQEQEERELEREERRKWREADDARQAAATRAQMAGHGVFEQGKGPGSPGAMTSSTADALTQMVGGALTGGIGASPASLKDWRAGPRYQSIGGGLEQDVTATDDWKDAAKRGEDRQASATLARSLMPRLGADATVVAELPKDLRSSYMSIVTREPPAERNPIIGSDAWKKAKEFEVRLQRGNRPPTQAELDRPQKERDRFVENLVAAYDGDLQAINQAMTSDPAIIRDADRLGFSTLELKSAVNRWKLRRPARGDDDLRGKIEAMP